MWGWPHVILRILGNRITQCYSNFLGWIFSKEMSDGNRKRVKNREQQMGMKREPPGMGKRYTVIRCCSSHTTRDEINDPRWPDMSAGREGALQEGGCCVSKTTSKRLDGGDRASVPHFGAVEGRRVHLGICHFACTSRRREKGPRRVSDYKLLPEVNFKSTQRWMKYRGFSRKRTRKRQVEEKKYSIFGRVTLVYM